ncbi:MAG: phospholipid carrier-dependent glycosyltransferase [Atribacterota bacterium]
MAEKIVASDKNDHSVKLYSSLLFLLILLIIAYSIVAFVNLGSRVTPETFWRAMRPGEKLIFDFGQVRDIDRLRYFGGVGTGQYLIDCSDDGQFWNGGLTLNFDGVFDIYVWKDFPIKSRGRFVRITVLQPGGKLYEVGFLSPNDSQPLPVANVSENPPEIMGDNSSQNLIDEPQTIATLPGYLNGMYFDEIYFARTAYEHLHHIEPYETSHPPLGKILISIGVALFGMNPFGWRIMGMLFGIAMIPLMYFFGLQLFHKPAYAFWCAFLIAFDCMHFSHSRISTIDVFLVFFLICSYYCMLLFYRRRFSENPLKRLLIPLFYSGIFFGMASAVKLSGIYAGFGLAVLFFSAFFSNYWSSRKARKKMREEEIPPEDPLYEPLRHETTTFRKYGWRIIIWCVLFFIIIPLVIYSAAFTPYLFVPNRGHGIQDLIQYQINMYNYHKNLKATHGYASPWWQWPLLIKPIWMYEGKGLPAGKISSIATMGNPLVWWPGTLALLAGMVSWFRKRDRLLFFILIGFLSQYVPWVLVPRLTFIYHYFPSVPFVIFCIVYLLQLFREKYHLPNVVLILYAIAVLLVFLMFYPVMSGMIVDKFYVGRFLRWLPSWFFYI